jgi:hypothetical protein
LGYLWKVPVCAVVYVVAMGIAGGAATQLGLQMPSLPEGVSQEQAGQELLLAALVLAAGLAPLAARQSGTYRARWLALGGLIYVALGLNTVLEASIFTTVPGMSSMALVFLPPTVLCAAALAGLLRPTSGTEPLATKARRFFRSRSVAQWLWRIPLAVLAFPVAYWTFGLLLMAVRPGLMEYYESGALGLTVPSLGTLLPVLFVRSSLFLAAALPVMIMWRGSRLGLGLALGLALSVLVGGVGMIEATWMPMEMRLGHGLEITADSFAHAFALVWLLVPKSQAGEPAQAG